MKVIRKFVSKLLGGKAPDSAMSEKNVSGAGSEKRRAPSADRPHGASGKKRPSKRPAAGTRRKGPPDARVKNAEGEPRREPGGKTESGQDGRSGTADNRGKNRRRRSGGHAKKTPNEPDIKHRVNANSSRVARPSASRGHQGQASSVSKGTRPGGGYSVDEREKLRQNHAGWSPDSYKVEPAADKKRFHDFDLPSEILHAVADLNFQYCTPIQALSLEHALAGKNVAGKAQTGTGKTAAFLIAILTRYLRSPEMKRDKSGCPRALVIAPTRELVIQICKDAAQIGKYCDLRTLAIYGGMDYQRQKDELLAEPIDLLVATPGRLLDYARRRIVDLSYVDTLVIDEADRMLDMGFIPDVRLIMNRLPRKDRRCTMLYSATLSQDVMRLASQWMEEPVSVEIDPENVATETVTQIVYVVTASEKFTVLYNLLQQYKDKRILVFCNRKATTEGVVRKLRRLNIACEMLSGDVNQNRRLRVLEDFREGKSRVVIATDVAGRGIHVDDVGFVVNYDFPYEAEDYVHRIGRTGRAGQEGTAISFADEDESFIIPEIEKYIGGSLKCTMLTGNDPLMAEIPRFSHRQGAHTVDKRQPPADEDSAEEKPAMDERPTEKTEPESKPVAADVPAVAAVSDAAPAEESAPGKTAPRPEPRRRESPKMPQSHRERPPVAPPEKTDKTDNAQKPPQPALRRPRFSDEWVPGEKK